jgi:hypothetical protein
VSNDDFGGGIWILLEGVELDDGHTVAHSTADVAGELSILFSFSLIKKITTVGAKDEGANGSHDGV